MTTVDVAPKSTVYQGVKSPITPPTHFPLRLVLYATGQVIWPPPALRIRLKVCIQMAVAVNSVGTLLILQEIAAYVKKVRSSLHLVLPFLNRSFTSSHRSYGTPWDRAYSGGRRRRLPYIQADDNGIGSHGKGAREEEEDCRCHVRCAFWKGRTNWQYSRSSEEGRCIQIVQSEVRIHLHHLQDFDHVLS